jgi:membrane protein implicated in regulation of membrane protease activity
MVGGYLFAAIVGWVLLGASLAGGHGAGSDGAHALALEHVDHATPQSVLLSLRFWTYVLAFGGTTGVLLHFTAGIGEPLTLLVSTGVGLVTGVTAKLAWSRLGNARGGTVREDELVGQTGRLLLGTGPKSSGRVRLTIRNASIDLIAASDDLVLPANEEVLVVSVRDGVAHVVRNPAEGRK